MLTGIKAMCFTFLIWGKHDLLFIFTPIDRVHTPWIFTACLLSETAAIFPEKMSAVPLLNVVKVHFWARQLSRKLRKCCSGALWREENQSSHAVMTQHKSIHLISCLISVNMHQMGDIICVSSGINYSQSTSRNVTIFRCKDSILNHPWTIKK